MKKIFTIIIALFIAGTALMAQTGNIVSMTTTETEPVTIFYEYTGTGSITANGVNLTDDNSADISPATDGSIIINATGSIQLTYLSVSDISLTQLDISQAIYLEELECEDNQLTELDITNNTALTWLYCNSNQLTELDATHNTELEDLRCSDNQLTQLFLPNSIALTDLFCYYNQLTELDVTNNTELTMLSCSLNMLTELDVTNNIRLVYLECYYNQLSELDVTNNVELVELFCSYNQLSSLDLSGIQNLLSLEADEQAVKVAVLEGAITFPNPIYYHNASEVEHAQINGIAYAFGTDVPMQDIELNFTTNSPYYGSPFSGMIFTVTGVQVTFISNGGTEIEPIVVALNKPIGTIVCEYQDYTLDGWYTEETFVNKWNLETDLVTETMTLYAKWDILSIDNFDTPSLTLYPNPATNQVTISGISAGDIIMVSDLSGRQVMRLRATAETQTIEISNLRAGVYVLSAGNTRGKLVIND